MRLQWWVKYLHRNICSKILNFFFNNQLARKTETCDDSSSSSVCQVMTPGIRVERQGLSWIFTLEIIEETLWKSSSQKLRQQKELNVLKIFIEKNLKIKIYFTKLSRYFEFDTLKTRLLLLRWATDHWSSCYAFSSPELKAEVCFLSFFFFLCLSVNIFVFSRSTRPPNLVTSWTALDEGLSRLNSAW